MIAPFAESWSRSVVFVLGLSGALLVTASSGPHPHTPESSSPANNSPPTVFLTGGPQDGETVPYRTEISWSGTDPDSGDALHHYEFAIDPPSVFTPTEIARPETSSPEGGFPQLTIREPVAGTFTFVGPEGTPQAAEVLAGVKLRFTWSATAEDYGGIIADYSWGVDIIDPTQGGVESGWSGWGQITSTGDLVFPEGGIHFLYVRARDTFGATTLGAIALNVLEFPFDRDVLIVDDYFDSIYPNDAQHDQFWREMASYYATNSDLTLDQFEFWDTFGPNDSGRTPNPPQLSELGRYKLLIWDNFGSGYAGRSGLLTVTAANSRLRTYLSGGGKLWLCGQLTVGATMATGGGWAADLSYPKTQLGSGDFAYDFLKLHTANVNNDKNAWEGNLFNRAKTYPGFPVYYDTLIVDISKLNYGLSLLGGVPFADAVFAPISAETEVGFRGNIDSLYVYGAAGNEFQGQNSGYQDKLCGLRWSDPDPDRLQGKIQWFGFPLYYTQNSHAERVFKQSIDWFRVDETVVPVRLLVFDANRIGEAVVVRWAVPDGQESVSFQVYREERGRDRRRLTAQGLSGRTRYEFVDESPLDGPAYYWLTALDRTGFTSWLGPVHLAAALIEQRLTLASIQPNPVRAEAQIAYNLPATGRVTLTIHDVIGRRVVTVLDAVEDAGKHTVTWHPRPQDGSMLATGFYLVRLESGGIEKVRKVLVLH